MSMAFELFLIGMAVSAGPCLVSCSGVILPYIAATRTGWKEGFIATAVFLLGRLGVYTLLGAFAGLSGKWLLLWLNNYSDFIYLAGGIIISFTAILIIFNIVPVSGLCSSSKTCRTGTRIKGPAMLGFAVGILPCLPLLGVLAYIALKSQNIFQASLLGMAFGLGKFISPLIPLGMLAASLPEKFINNKRMFGFFSRACGFILLILGVNLIVYKIWK